MAIHPSTEQPTLIEGEPRIGVFICDCGDKIVGILDTNALIESVRELPAVVFAERAPYWCSADGRERMQAVIRDYGLQRVVVAGCSPRTHKRLFRGTMEQVTMNPDLLGMVNIREGCAWPHRGEHKAATVRAWDQIAMEVAHMAALTLRPHVQAEIAPTTLVIGGGSAGMTAALEIADAGIPVTLVELAAKLGGSFVDKSSVLVWELIECVERHPNITVLLSTKVTQVNGSVGGYRIITAYCGNLSVATETSNRQYGPFGAIIVATGEPHEESRDLARLLRLTQDAEGYIPELRVRLRPRDYVERGIYVCGSAHYPCSEARAQSQAYSAASRALRHLRRGGVTAHGPLAEVVPEKCNGCGDCFQVCPFAAVTMVERPSGLSLSSIDPLLCTGCGNCVSICPVGAVTVPGWTDAQLEAQMDMALGCALQQYPSGSFSASRTSGWQDDSQVPPRKPDTGPRILVFACEWSGYAAAELAGALKLTYPPNVRMIRLDCTGRLQPGLILKAFERGAAGVLVLGCEPRSCHYERGNERAAMAYGQVDALIGLLGLPRTRLQLAWIPADDGSTFAELVTGFVRGVEETIEAAV